MSDAAEPPPDASRAAGDETQPLAPPPNESAAKPQPASPTPRRGVRVLEEEEYIEQAYFFRTFRERLEDNRPAQEVLRTVGEEILATTKLPMAIEFLAIEAERRGRMAGAMARLPHYFAAFQTFVIAQAEDDRSRFPFETALAVLQNEAEYRAGLHERDDPLRTRRAAGVADVPAAEPAGLFTYQFEAIARNRLGYADGLDAMAADPLYQTAALGDSLGHAWPRWIRGLPHRLGTADFADLMYARSWQAVEDVRRLRQEPDWQPEHAPLFGEQEGRIAKANRGRDPLYLFAALQRQLGYPAVPRTRRVRRDKTLDPATELRFQRLEAKLLMLENEQKGGLDLSEFYRDHPEWSPDKPSPNT